MTTDPFDKAKLIPPSMRGQIAAGQPPLYRITRPDLDRLPLGTFIVLTVMGTGGRVFEGMMRLVEPNDPPRYAPKKLTPDKRLLYVFWAKGHAVKMLADAKGMLARHLILPTDPEFAGMDAFKIACDTKRAWSEEKTPFKPDLAYRVLKIQRFDIAACPAIVTQ